MSKRLQILTLEEQLLCEALAGPLGGRQRSEAKRLLKEVRALIAHAKRVLVHGPGPDCDPED